jgi:outer membrane protein assembly factor BamB
VPQLLDKVVREYAADGKILWEYRTPETPAESWPFTAIRVPGGNTLINCTHGNMAVEVDRKGRIVWQLTNADLPQPWLKDPCGAQRLANGNTVITSYAAGEQKVKLLEVDRSKKVVWTHEEPRSGGIHEFQILTTNGRKERWPAMR